MAKQCRIMPEIHDQVLNLIDNVHHCHASGQGALPMSAIVKLFGAAIEPTDLQKIDDRGPVKLIKTSASGGRFENEGKSFDFRSNGITVKVPQRIEGNYISFADNFSLLFSEVNTLIGRIFFLSAKVKDIDANKSKIDIDVTGDSFDQCIIHEPE